MEEKKMTEKESFELIASMIQNTKKRMELGSGNILIAWGYVTVIVALVVGCGYMATGNVAWLWCWFAVPLVGCPLHWALAKKKDRMALVKTVVDGYVSRIWAGTGMLFVLMMVLCLGFGLGGYNAWGVMYLMTLPLCGLASMATGVILKERSLMTGGVVSAITGSWFIICQICRIDIFGYDVFAFAFCFAVMMVIPGHIINRKARKAC